MTIVVLGLDALDADLVEPERHPHLTLNSYSKIDTLTSSAGEPSTHELWPTIITGLTPEEHGLELQDGVSWDNPLLSIGSRLSDYVVPDRIQTKIGAWILNNTKQDTFRTPATYYEKNQLRTLFDGYESKAIGIPNYVTDNDVEDREHRLRRGMGELFERDPGARGGHRSDDPVEFYEACMEMSMVRIARVRRALRSKKYELVFGYTSGLDLIGHISYDVPELQNHAYDELNDFVGELRSDLLEKDELVIISDHGLQDGLHTQHAMIAGTDEDIVRDVESVVVFKHVIEEKLESENHLPEKRDYRSTSDSDRDEVRSHLEDLGYM